MEQTPQTVNSKGTSWIDRLAKAMSECFEAPKPRSKYRPPYDPVDEASRESFPASDAPAWPVRPF